MKNIISFLFIMLLSLITIVFFVFSGCSLDKSLPEKDLFAGFENPPAEARPFVRWWWNGNKIKREEIDRELNLLKDAGFGGVEINPIAFPEGSVETGDTAKIWMSDEWIDLLVHACMKAKDMGMITDLIVGSGWPFGGEFLEEDEVLQRIALNTVKLANTKNLTLSVPLLKELLEKQTAKEKHPVHFNPEYQHELLFAHILPEIVNNKEDIIDLTKILNKQEPINYSLPDTGIYSLSYGFRQRGHRQVVHGAPGAAGPVMDHYNKEVTLAYLSRLLKISEKTGIPLQDLLRALFCDSIELAGANWTDGFARLFVDTYGYHPEPFLSFIFKPDSKASDGLLINEDFSDSIKRVRYDYNRLLVDLFLDNFTRSFQDFCEEQNLKCRYQAYGTPFLMGILEGNMIPDIPESNNWIFSAEMNSPSWKWNPYHGYMAWNLYAAAGGHLTGKRIISCEAMTNTRGVFKTSLEQIKQHDDMNFITGINHSILHGYNYSPHEAGFPGWIRYGAYFSEHNTWWPYISRWVNYNARLSWIFQNSQPVKSIAILGPSSDIWAEKGLERSYLQNQPAYLYRLWEPVSQCGYSCEYLNERVIQGAKIRKGTLQFGNMNYRSLILADVKSMHPETALQIEKFVKSGGEIIIIGTLPFRSLHLSNADINDQKVHNVFTELQDDYPENVWLIDSPASKENLLNWTQNLFAETNIEPDIQIANPSESVYQIHTKTKDQEIYFFTNVHRADTAIFEAKFPVKNRVPFIWNPETGERNIFAVNPQKPVNISIAPLNSLLVVFEKGNKNIEVSSEKKKSFYESGTINHSWVVNAYHIDGSEFTRSFDSLKDFSKSDDPELNTFAGKLFYQTEFLNTGNITHLSLGNLNGGIVRLTVNGIPTDVTWYGNALYNIKPLLKDGNNKVIVEYTSLIHNYCSSLNDPVSERWTNKNERIPVGLTGPVSLLELK